MTGVGTSSPRPGRLETSCHVLGRHGRRRSDGSAGAQRIGCAHTLPRRSGRASAHHRSGVRARQSSADAGRRLPISSSPPGLDPSIALGTRQEDLAATIERRPTSPEVAKKEWRRKDRRDVQRSRTLPDAVRKRPRAGSGADVRSQRRRLRHPVAALLGFADPRSWGAGSRRDVAAIMRRACQRSHRLRPRVAPSSARPAAHRIWRAFPWVLANWGWAN